MTINLGILIISGGDGRWWARFGSTGPGLAARHRRHPPLFSERYGYGRRVWPKYPARWRFELLDPAIGGTSLPRRRLIPDSPPRRNLRLIKSIRAEQ